jgi:predicted amidohydrolase
MVKIGSWQGPIKANDLDQNLHKVATVLEQSKSMGLDFLCFPETYLSGYTVEAIHGSAVELSDRRICDFIQQSAQYDTVILLGMSEREGDKIFNTELVIYKGELLGKYRKKLFTPLDAQCFTTDSDYPVFEAKGIKFGVVICLDTSYVEPAMYLRMKGARLLFTPHYNAISAESRRLGDNRYTQNFWEHRAMVLNNQAALATLLEMVVVRSNVVVFDEKGLGAGDSNIWDMNGMLVAQGVPFTECIVMAEFDNKLFSREERIDRSRIPTEWYQMIEDAAKEYSSLQWG